MRVGNKDNGGTYISLKNVVLLSNVDWFDILNRNAGKEMYLCTFGNPDGNKMHKAVSLITNGKVIIGTRYSAREWDVEKRYSNVRVKYDSHAKILLIAPDEVFLSSQNIEYDDWYQTTVHIKDRRAYNHYYEQFMLEWDVNGVTEHKTYETGIITPEDEIRYLSMCLPQPIVGTISRQNKELCLEQCNCKMVAMKIWKTKIAQIRDSYILISTQTMPNQKYVCECLDLLQNHNNHITLVVNTNPKLVQKLGELYPSIQIIYCANIHSKMVLHSGNNVWLSSQNFGHSGSDWFESAIQIKDERAYTYYYEQLRDFLGFDIE